MTLFVQIDKHWINIDCIAFVSTCDDNKNFDTEIVLKKNASTVHTIRTNLTVQQVMDAIHAVQGNKNETS